MAQFIKCRIKFLDDTKKDKNQFVYENSLLNLDAIERFVVEPDGSVLALTVNVDAKGANYVYPLEGMTKESLFAKLEYFKTLEPAKSNTNDKS